MSQAIKKLIKKNHKMNEYVTIITALIFLMTPLTVLGLPADTQEKLHIFADSGVYNYKTGNSLFEGHVKVDQGTTHIVADRLTTKSNSKHQIKEAVAYGLDQLAHYWTLPKLGDVEIHAKAKIIKFYPIESNVTLEEDVTVIQGENSFQGQLIHYNMKDQTITVPASKRGRAVLIYDPDK